MVDSGRHEHIRDDSSDPSADHPRWPSSQAGAEPGCHLDRVGHSDHGDLPGHDRRRDFGHCLDADRLGRDRIGESRSHTASMTADLRPTPRSHLPGQCRPLDRCDRLNRRLTRERWHPMNAQLCTAPTTAPVRAGAMTSPFVSGWTAADDSPASTSAALVGAAHPALCCLVLRRLSR